MIDTAHERPPEAVREIVRATGCVLHETIVVPTVDGDGMPSKVHAYRIGCPSEQHRLDLLVELAVFDGRYFPQLQLLSRKLCAPHKSDAGRVEAIHGYVAGALSYAREPVETFLSAPMILRLGIGDCDDHVTVMLALLVAAGIEADAVQVGAHVAARALVGSSWWWCETTVAARLGEHPIDAGKRLGLFDRKDLS